MLKKLMLYLITAIIVGIITMMMPIGLMMLLTKMPGATVTQENYTKETTSKTLMEGYGLTIERFRETARFYGESDVAEGDIATDGKSSLSTSHNILASLVMVASAGLLAVLITRLVMRAVKGAD